MTAHRSVAMGLWSDKRTPKRGATAWAELGLLALVSGALLVLIGFLLAEAIKCQLSMKSTACKEQQ